MTMPQWEPAGTQPAPPAPGYELTVTPNGTTTIWLDSADSPTERITT